MTTDPKKLQALGALVERRRENRIEIATQKGTINGIVRHLRNFTEAMPSYPDDPSGTFRFDVQGNGLRVVRNSSVWAVVHDSDLETLRQSMKRLEEALERKAKIDEGLGDVG